MPYVITDVELVAGHVKIENEIVTDEFCRTNVEDIFAAGDVANSWHPRVGSSARLEHFDNAQLSRHGASVNRYAESVAAMRLLHQEIEGAMLIDESVDIETLRPRSRIR
jgi:NADPH-dependent 2,4-dienoyl-CoA reductase/sulfur reductase-like enzyme